MKRLHDAPPRLQGAQLRINVSLGPTPIPLEQLDRWAEQYLEYILEDEGLLPLQKPSAA